jgi:predicted dehydrogenase
VAGALQTVPAPAPPATPAPRQDIAESLQRQIKEKTGLKYMMAETSYYVHHCIAARELFQEGKFGQLFYSEVEYYHDRGDLEKLVSDKTSRFYEPGGQPSWRWGLPPMHYPTHSLGYVVGVTGERITRVSCLGWGSRHPWTGNNPYRNPFWNQAALMQTGGGHMVRCNVFWLIGAEGERAQWFGEKGSLYMSNAGLHPDTWKDRLAGKKPLVIPEYWKSDMLPEPMRHPSGHGGSAVFLSAEFINALVEDREPAIDLSESLAMTVPGIVAHQSALRKGEQLAVPQF